MQPVKDVYLIEGFVSEAKRLLETIRPDLQAMSGEPSSATPPVTGAILSTVNSIKNASAMLGDSDLQNFCLVLERVLVRLRRQTLSPSRAVVSTILQAVDKLEVMVEHSPNASEISYRREITKLEEILGRRLAAPPMHPPRPKPAAQVFPKGRHKVLVVEDDSIVGRLLRERIMATEEFTPLLASSLAETKEVIAQEPGDLFAAVLDLNLPDAPNGEVVDYVGKFNIPSIVLTASMDEDTRARVAAKKVADYVVKTGASDLDYLVRVLKRLLKNQGIQIMVVEDSKALRANIRNLLELQRYRVLEAGDGEEALEILHKNPGISAIITDYQMPNMDGLELVSSIRSRFGKNQLAIIGISGTRSGLLTAKFLKSGANDFLVKPFLTEEFYCRVSQNIELVEMFDKLLEASIRDHLTGLYNRRYFFEQAQPAFDRCLEEGGDMAVAIIDIDHFKKINDSHGHDAGDAALQHISRLLDEAFGKRGLVCRFGGEEFGVLLTGKQAAGAQVVLNVFRKRLENKPVEYRGNSFNMTISIGLNTVLGKNLTETIKGADKLLYQAKETGRNSVCHQ